MTSSCLHCFPSHFWWAEQLLLLAPFDCHEAAAMPMNMQYEREFGLDLPKKTVHECILGGSYLASRHFFTGEMGPQGKAKLAQLIDFLPERTKRQMKEIDRTKRKEAAATTSRPKKFA